MQESVENKPVDNVSEKILRLGQILNANSIQKDGNFYFQLENNLFHKEITSFLIKKRVAKINSSNQLVIEEKKIAADLDIDGIAQILQKKVDEYTNYLEKRVTAPANNIDPSKIDYKVLISEKTLAKIEKYRNDLISNLKKPGGHLKQLLALYKKTVDQFSLHEFIDLLFQTKVPTIFAESEILGNGLDWAPQELEILGEMSVAVPTAAYDNASFTSPALYDEPLNATLVYTPGALLVGNSPDKKAVVTNNEINDKALEELYENRLLPVLKYISQSAEQNGKKALVTIPGLGCGQFAGNFRGQLGEKLKNILVSLIKKHGDQLPGIRGIYFHTFQEGSYHSEKINDIKFISQVGGETKDIPGLNTPKFYEDDEPGIFDDCDLYSLVAWDHVSWPTNDLIRGSRATDDGIKGAATDTLTKITGYPGSYIKLKYTPDNYRKWLDCIMKEGLSLPAKNRIYILKNGKLEHLKDEHNLNQSISTKEEEIPANNVAQKTQTSTSVNDIPGTFFNSNKRQCTPLQEFEKELEKIPYWHRDLNCDKSEQLLHSGRYPVGSLIVRPSSQKGSIVISKLRYEDNNPSNELEVAHVKLEVIEDNGCYKLKTIDGEVLDSIADLDAFCRKNSTPLTRDEVNNNNFNSVK